MKSDKLIVALDDMSYADAIDFGLLLKGKVWGFKLHSLILLHGIAVISQFKKYGKVFADLKLHDIPFTVANHVKTLGNADFISIHLVGGAKMIQAAMDVKRENQKILGVLKLSSVNWPIKSAIFDFSTMVDGMIGPPMAEKQENQIIVTSGIRPMGFPDDDHGYNSLTPKDAIESGADYIVVGRPITKSPYPYKACEQIIEEIS